MKRGWAFPVYLLVSQVLLLSCMQGTGSSPQDVPPTQSSIRLPPQWTATPWAGPTSEAVAVGPSEWAACPDDPTIPLSNLKAGMTAFISTDIIRTVQLRDIAGWVGSRNVGSLLPGEQVEILEGPVCMDQFVWWRVKSSTSGSEGWVIEGNQYESWLLPQQ